MTYFFLLGGLFLGWSFGRNNLSNVFGTAIGTRMVSFRSAALLAGIFIMLGALFSGDATTSSMLAIGLVDSPWGAFWISLAIGMTILMGGYLGIPVSIAQSAVGALVGWNLFWHIDNKWHLIGEMAAAWFYCPVLAAVFAVFGFCFVRFLLKYIQIPILFRDFWVRVLLVLSGVYSAYYLGANNVASISSLYLGAQSYPFILVLISISIAIAVGVLMADRRVIETVSFGLFPLSPLEALVVVGACGMTLSCFSGEGFNVFLQAFNLPTLPLVPIPTSNVLVGSIIGVGLVKGHWGIRWSTLGKIFVSWVSIPVISGLICWLILSILIQGG